MVFISLYQKNCFIYVIKNDVYYFCENYPLRFGDSRGTWYLIGASSKDLKTMNHEIAHGLFYTNKNYRSAVLYQLSLIPKKTIDKIYKKLII